MPENAATHYEIRVNRPFEFVRARFRPGARYTVKASIYDQIVAEMPEVIASANPIKKG
jgi:hypothetical protein